MTCEPCGPCPKLADLPKVAQRSVVEAYQLGAFVGSNHDPAAAAVGYEANPFNQGNAEWHAWNVGKETGTLLAAAKGQSGIR